MSTIRGKSIGQMQIRVKETSKNYSYNSAHSLFIPARQKQQPH